MSNHVEIHHVTTDDEMRALGHPLRLRLLGLLRIDGPATATTLAERVGESSGVTSYHLRYLAERNFVEDAPDLGNKRERWWRAAQQTTEWDPADFIDSKAGRIADLTFRREALRFTRGVVDNWMVDETTWPRDWVSAAIMSDVMLTLSVDQLRALAQDYRELIEKYDDLSSANEEECAECERVLVVLHATPLTEANP